MTPKLAPRHRGVILTVAAVPAGFLAFLERAGLAGQAARTDEGVYLQPPPRRDHRGLRPRGCARAWLSAGSDAHLAGIGPTRQRRSHAAGQPPRRGLAAHAAGGVASRTCR